MHKAQLSSPVSRKNTFLAPLWEHSPSSALAWRHSRVPGHETVPGRVQTVMRQPSSPCPPLGLFTNVDATICAQTHFLSLNTQNCLALEGPENSG